MDLVALKDTLKKGVYTAHQNGARIDPVEIGSVDENNNRVGTETSAVCLLVAQIIGERWCFNYVCQAAIKLEITFKEADELQIGFLTLPVSEPSEFVKLGAEIYHELVDEGIIRVEEII